MHTIKKIRAHYSGSVFRPLDEINLKDDIDVTISIIIEDTEKSEDLWDILDKYSGTVEGPSDWSSEHDHYIYGTLKNDPKDVLIN